MAVAGKGERGVREIFVAFAVFVVFTLRTITGFGSAMLLSPILSAIIPPKEAVVLIILLENEVNFVYLMRERLNFSLKEVFAGAIIGILCGILLFKKISQEELRMLIGIFVTAFAILILFGFRFEVPKRFERAFFFALGNFSGAMGVLTSINGPQIVLGLANQGYDSKFIRIFIISYLIVIDFITLMLFMFAGELCLSILKFGFLCIPSLLFAYTCGKIVEKRMSKEFLRFLMLVLSLFAGILAVLRSIL